MSIFVKKSGEVVTVGKTKFCIKDKSKSMLTMVGKINLVDSVTGKEQEVQTPTYGWVAEEIKEK